MSRVGKAPVTIPSGVDVSIAGETVTVKGPKGELTQPIPQGISVAVDDGQISVSRADDERQNRALHGLTRSLVANMVTGVTEGFTKSLEIQGVGYRCQAKGKDKIELALGFSHPVEIEAPEGIEFDVPSQTEINVKGIDKQLVGQVAADIRKWRKPEPYKGKGIRYVGERVMRKAGKAAK